MQPQSKINSKSKFKNQQQQQQFPATPTNRSPAATLQQTPTTNTAAATATAQDITKRSPAVKVVKCKKPLCHFKFYLDIRDHQLTRRIEEQIKLLGGTQEFFLTSSITHFVTDKQILPSAAVTSVPVSNNNQQNTSCPGTPQTPQTPQTPLTPYSLECLNESGKQNNGVSSKKPIRSSRANAILNRARRQSTINVSTPTTSYHQTRGSTADQTCVVTPLKPEDNLVNNAAGSTTPPPYVVWQCENALRFFKKVQHELKNYLDHSSKSSSRKSYAVEPISFKGGFIKFESIKRNYRPYYHLIKKPQEWPKIELSREDGAFRLSPKKDLSKILEGALDDNMTRKSRTKSSQNHHNNLKTKNDDIFKSPANSQKQTVKCKNQTPQQQKDSSDKQCGVCEICKIEYDALTIHLKTKDHEYFAKNSQNFIALDSLIHSSADVNKFLDENRKLEIKTELEEMEVDHDELSNNEQDPLSNNNANQANGGNEDDEDDDEEDDESQKSIFTSKGKSIEYKMVSPTLREKSKRSTKGKHSSEKFQNCAITTKTPKISSPQKPLTALDIKTPLAKKKPSSSAAISPPIRAILPPNSLYKVVETHTEVNCTPPKGKGVGAGLNDDKAVGSPSIIVKFKKVRTTELQVLNGEAENFMFPKKRSDSSDLPTDIDRHTTSEGLQNTQSSQQLLSSSSSSSEEQEPEDEMEVKHNSRQTANNSKQTIVKANKRLSKVCPSSPSKYTLGGENKQSFRKTPIQPIEQLKTENRSTSTTTTKRGKKILAQENSTKVKNVAAVVNVSNKIVLPEATRKSSRTATAIVTAATTSTRLLQAAVEAAKSKQKLETSTKPKIVPPPQQALLKNFQIKQELKNDSEEEDHLKAMRCRRRSVVKMEDRMGDIRKKSQTTIKNKDTVHVFDVNDYEDDDDDISIDGDDFEDDDEKDKDFIVKTVKMKSKTASTAPKMPSITTHSTTTTSSNSTKSSSKKNLWIDTPTQINSSLREERLARRQSRLITQLQLELQTNLEEEQCSKSHSKPKEVEKKSEKATVSDKKTPMKQPKVVAYSKKTLAKKTSVIKKETSPVKKETLTIKQDMPISTKHTYSGPSRYFDYTKSERLKAICYAFERLPASDLWYRVYKRQDNCDEKYFEYFGSTKYRKLPYELGPIPFETTLFDCNKRKVSCKLCQDVKVREESKQSQKNHTRRDLHIDLKLKNNEALSNSMNFQESQDKQNCSSSSHNEKQQHLQTNTTNQDQEHSKPNYSSSNTETKSYAHKHKKLLQRYRQELEEQEHIQEQTPEENQVKSCFNESRVMPCGSANIKAENATQESLISRQEREGSAHSNASSCASSTHTNCKSKKMRNKLLNKVSFLANLELPPRKSPREHASTLALVSCIIKQRQDSLSIPNSEIDEPPTTPTETDSKVLALAAEKLSTKQILEKELPKTPPLSAQKTSECSGLSNVVSSPRTRSQAATPIEELRFATEISETVKRMRRGRNKYDYSPPFVQRSVGRPSSARGRGRGSSKGVVNLWGTSHKVAATSHLPSSSVSRQGTHTPNTGVQHNGLGTTATRGRRKRGRQKGYNLAKNSTNVLASIRKTGSKKGVLEFEVDNVALEALRKATDYVNPKLLEWQIDKYLTLSNKDYEKDFLAPAINVTTPPEEDDIMDENELDSEFIENVKSTAHSVPAAINDIALNTPPATDCFSSDFDLCDLINQSSERLQDADVNGANNSELKTKFSIFNSVHLNKYYRKRKNPKSNRTGWPKLPKKKAVTRQQSMQDKIYFLQNGGIREEMISNNTLIVKQESQEVNNLVFEQDDTTHEQTGEGGVITPPDTDNELQIEKAKNVKREIGEQYEANYFLEEDSQIGLNEDSQTVNDDEEEEDDEGEEEDYEMAESQRVVEDDNDTMADYVQGEDEDEDEEQQQHPKADSDADADIEEADEDEVQNQNITKFQENKKVNKKCKKIIPKIIENDDEDSYEPQEKRSRCLPESPVEKLRTNLLNPNSAHTSTPTTTPFMRALRRTPQLNGSLGSCISPSEKAGDNSDIFTVSSDGLDTDMDMSNSHCQLRSNIGYDDDDHNNSNLHNNTNSTVTPKRKFDISKYAPSNSATCAAEAATAAVKSLAISQFLKKEVRVNCRRLRTPFRRFRYRR